MGVELILFGDTCSGKTTVAQILKNEITHEVVSAKDVIARNLGTASSEVKALRSKGCLLPDDVIIRWIFGVIDERKNAGAKLILDGFPRTAAQARCLVELEGRAAKVVHLSFDLDTLKRRWAHRLLCRECDMPHSSLFSDFDGTCPHCRARALEPRPTDRPDYLDVKTAQFASVTAHALPVLRDAGMTFLSVGDHRSFAGLRAETLSRIGATGKSDGN